MQSKEKFLSKPINACIAAIICCALWGSAFPFIKIGYLLFEIQGADYYTQILFAGIRFTLAGVLTVIFGSIVSKKILLPKKSSIIKIPVLSLFQTVFQYIFFYIGLAHTTGTKASVINSVSVFFAVIISAVIFRQDRLTLKKAAGCIIGFAGVVIINFSAAGSLDFDFGILGDGFIVLSSLSYAFSSVFLKKFSRSENTVVLSGYQFFFGGIVMIIVGLIFGGNISVFSFKGALLIIYLAFVSAAAYTLWGLLLKYNNVSKVAVFGFMTPVFGCILSALFLKEAMTQTVVQVIISLIFVCAGIYLVNIKGNRKKQKEN